MRRLLLHVLVSVTACSTVVAGMPAVTATCTAGERGAGSIAAAPADGATAAECRDTDSGAELEEETDSKVHGRTGRIGGEWPESGGRRCAAAHAGDVRPTERPSATSIRGPPVA